jgi:competence protein ComEA
MLNGLTVWEQRAMAAVLVALSVVLCLQAMRSDEAKQDDGSIQRVINVNEAGIKDLESLPWIGPVKARAIMDHREEHGAFQSIEQLDDVYGIGEKTVARLRGNVTIEPQ